MAEDNSIKREPYHLNAEGDFYAEQGTCMMCMMPELQAPELMGFDRQAPHCYFRRQPQTPEELEHAITAIIYSEVQGLRYAGNDEYVLRRLIEQDCADCCDVLCAGKSRDNVDES